MAAYQFQLCVVSVTYNWMIQFWEVTLMQDLMLAREILRQRDLWQRRKFAWYEE